MTIYHSELPGKSRYIPAQSTGYMGTVTQVNEDHGGCVQCLKTHFFTVETNLSVKLAGSKQLCRRLRIMRLSAFPLKHTTNRIYRFRDLMLPKGTPLESGSVMFRE